jgi:hypothetical protein
MMALNAAVAHNKVKNARVRSIDKVSDLNAMMKVRLRIIYRESPGTQV